MDKTNCICQFYTALQVGELLGISRSRAYKVVRELNEELKAMGYITIAGKIPCKFFAEKFYTSFSA